MGMNLRDRNAGLATAQSQVWGFDSRTGIDSRSYFAPGAKIFYVDPNNAQATDAGNLGEDPTVPLATVQAALALVRAYQGDTIIVGANDAWQYAPHVRGTVIQESLVIPWTAGGVRIVGASTNPLGVAWEAANPGEFCISVYGMDILIEGFCFTGSLTHACDGIYAEWDGLLLNGENLTVRNCFFDAEIDTAIQLEFAWYSQIYNNWFFECDEYGVYVDPAGSGIAHCCIADNWLQNLGISALSLRGADDCNVGQNVIFNANARAGALATDEGIDTTGGEYNLIHHNTLSCLLPAAANGDLDDLCTGSVTDAWIANNCLDGLQITTPT